MNLSSLPADVINKIAHSGLYWTTIQMRRTSKRMRRIIRPLQLSGELASMFCAIEQGLLYEYERGTIMYLDIPMSYANPYYWHLQNKWDVDALGILCENPKTVQVFDTEHNPDPDCEKQWQPWRILLEVLMMCHTIGISVKGGVPGASLP